MQITLVFVSSSTDCFWGSTCSDSRYDSEIVANGRLFGPIAILCEGLLCFDCGQSRPAAFEP